MFIMPKTYCEICDQNFKNEESLQHHRNAKHLIKEVKSRRKFPLFLVISIIIVILIIFFAVRAFSGPGKYDTFAQCLTDNGAKMYGAYWCPHCIEQKKLFGKSFNNVNYIECSLPNRGGQNAECNAAGIESYPTWEFADGKRVGGSLSLEQLSQNSNCQLTKDV